MRLSEQALHLLKVKYISIFILLYMLYITVITLRMLNLCSLILFSPTVCARKGAEWDMLRDSSNNKTLSAGVF